VLGEVVFIHWRDREVPRFCQIFESCPLCPSASLGVYSGYQCMNVLTSVTVLIGCSKVENPVYELCDLSMQVTNISGIWYNIEDGFQIPRGGSQCRQQGCKKPTFLNKFFRFLGFNVRGPDNTSYRQID